MLYSFESSWTEVVTSTKIELDVGINTDILQRRGLRFPYVVIYRERER